MTRETPTLTQLALLLLIGIGAYAALYLLAH